MGVLSSQWCFARCGAAAVGARRETGPEGAKAGRQVPPSLRAVGEAWPSGIYGVTGAAGRRQACLQLPALWEKHRETSSPAPAGGGGLVLRRLTPLVVPLWKIVCAVTIGILGCAC